jgi:hypothetical protein
MIINGQSFIDSFKCKKKLAEYLIYKKHFPVFNVDETYYYFVNTDLLKEVLEGLPLWMKIANKI